MIDLIKAERDWVRLKKSSEALRKPQTVEDKLERIRKLALIQGLDLRDQVALQWGYMMLKDEAVFSANPTHTVKEVNDKYIEHVLASTRGRWGAQIKSARILGVDVATIHRWAKAASIRDDDPGEE